MARRWRWLLALGLGGAQTAASVQQAAARLVLWLGPSMASEAWSAGAQLWLRGLASRRQITSPLRSVCAEAWFTPVASVVPAWLTERCGYHAAAAT